MRKSLKIQLNLRIGANEKVEKVESNVFHHELGTISGMTVVF